MQQVTNDIDLLMLNNTELAQLIRRQTGMVVKRSMGREEMIEVLGNNRPLFPGGEKPLPDQMGGGTYYEDPEISNTDSSRKRLQLYIEKNWVGIQSQLPCKGDNRGRCTIYPCPEARHIDCLLAAGPHLKIHGLQA